MSEWSGSSGRPSKRSRSEEKESEKKEGTSSTAAAAGGTAAAAPSDESADQQQRWRPGQQPPYGSMFPPHGGYPPPMSRYPPQWQPGPYGPPGPPMGGGPPHPMYPYQGGPFPPYPPPPQPPHVHIPPYYPDHPAAAAAAGMPPRFPEGGEAHGTGEIGDGSMEEPDAKPAAKRARGGPPGVAPSRISRTQDDRRSRKNAQSRARAAKLREKIDQIKNKPESELTEEERETLKAFEERRQRKNDRSRERAIEKKTEMERILAKPERKRTRQEKKFLEVSLKAKHRKNEGDRVRRQRIKQMGLKPSGGGSTTTSSSRGAPSGAPATAASLPHYAHVPGMPEIPMSPLPSTHQAHLQSPSAAFASPGLAIRFPSPPNARGGGGASTPGVLETPGGTSEGMPLPYHYGEGHAGATPPARSQLHLPQSSSRIEQRRHPDGSMTIAIGGARSSAASAARASSEQAPPFCGEVASRSIALEEASPGDLSEGTNQNAAATFGDVSQLLLYSDNGEEGEGGENNAPATGGQGRGEGEGEKEAQV